MSSFCAHMGATNACSAHLQTRMGGANVEDALQQPLIAGKAPDADSENGYDDTEDEDDMSTADDRQGAHASVSIPSPLPADVDRLHNAQSSGVVYVVGRSTVYARASSNWLRKVPARGRVQLLGQQLSRLGSCTAHSQAAADRGGHGV